MNPLGTTMLLKVQLVALTVLMSSALAQSAPIASQEAAADAQLIEKRMQEGRTWIRENPWPDPKSRPDWKLLHAVFMAEADQQAGPLNQAILEYCQFYKLDPKARPTAYHDLRPKPALYFLYLKPKFNRLLSDKAKDAIEDACWRWVFRHSFVSENEKWPLNKPKESVWYISGSENHCAAQRSANLLSLQILMKAGKPYGPKAKLYDGETVEAHYKEWVRWYQEFFHSRRRSGLTCEIAHPSSYGNATISHYSEIEDLTDSVELKQAARDYLDIFWANVACEFEPRTGIRASFASTRCYKWSWIQSGMYWARSLLYAYGWSDVKSNPNLVDTSCFLSEYRPPAILRAIARDHKRGPYMGTSRRFGRGTGWDKGVYKVLFDDGKAMNSYMRRDSWYTQAYTMSTISLDPGRDYIELVDQSRVMGVQFATKTSDRLVVYAGNRPAEKKREYKMETSNGVIGMLGPDCMIVARDPNANAKKSNSTRIFISDGALWDNREENDGWFFTRAGDGYAAFRISGKKGYDVVASPYKNGTFIEFKDIWAPIVIQMAQAKDYKNDFARFKAAVKGTAVTYDKGKLDYTELSGDTYEYWSRSKTLPRRNGQTIDLNPEMVYDFPYLKMKYGEDQATISYPGYPDLLVPANKQNKEAKQGIAMGVTIGLIGDSTVAKQSGWGPAFASRFNGEAQILNYAKNGGFLESMSKWLEKLIENEPDYVLIQFGHNDQKRYDTKAYSQKLRSYIKRIQEAGGKPIILSSVVRRSFDKNGKIVSRKHDAYKANLTAYADAAMAVAKDMNLPFIDLHRISEAHHNEIGRKESMTYNFKEGDRTHFNKKGGQAITDLILPELKKVAPELTTWLVVNKNPKEHKAFEKALNGDWETVLSDSCTEDWKKKWFLDGEVGQVTTGPDGMALTAGPEFKNDAHHMVLWTKDVFEGDVKIEYDYTRLDEATNCVNILYIQATGSGEEPYVRDITKWNELRKIPAMKTYFNHMHTYHISYAVGEPSNGYIRARRYMPNATGLKGSDLKPDYFPKGMFATGVPHKIAVIKKDRDIFMRIENDEQTYYCHMTNPDLPIVTEGRIGLRHMFTRSARYKNFKISTPSK